MSTQNFDYLNMDPTRKPSTTTKTLECWFWKRGGCKKPEDQCLYAHRPTGKVAEKPLHVGSSTRAMAGKNLRRTLRNLNISAEDAKSYYNKQILHTGMSAVSSPSQRAHLLNTLLQKQPKDTIIQSNSAFPTKTQMDMLSGSAPSNDRGSPVASIAKDFSAQLKHNSILKPQFGTFRDDEVNDSRNASQGLPEEQKSATLSSDVNSEDDIIKAVKNIHISQARSQYDGHSYGTIQADHKFLTMSRLLNQMSQTLAYQGDNLDTVKRSLRNVLFLQLRVLADAKGGAIFDDIQTARISTCIQELTSLLGVLDGK